MLEYVLVDIAPFIVLGVVLTITFGMAFMVLFANSFDEDDAQNFNSPWRSFESTFHAILGQFDPEVIQRTSSPVLVIMLPVDLLHTLHELLDCLAFYSL